MKNSLRTTLAAAVLATLAAAPALAATKYGKGVSDATPVKLSELMATPDAYVGKVVKVEGLVTEVCPKRGCWINVAGDKEFQTIRVKVEDGVIVFPLTDKGKKVVAEGTFTKMELTKEQAIERAKHEAEETRTKCDPQSITGPQTVFQIMGIGAVVDWPCPVLNWRKLNNVLHRDLGYLAAGLTLVYAISGVAVNHRHQWNPSWKVEVETRTFEPVPVADRDTMTANLVERLALPGPPKSSFRSAPHLVELFYEGWSVKADATAGTATIERPRGRFGLREMNFLHLNEPKGLWTWAADVYAVILGFLAISGLFVLKGKNGLSGRGKWLTGIGVAIPLLALAFLLWRPGDRGPRGEGGSGRAGGRQRGARGARRGRTGR